MDVSSLFHIKTLPTNKNCDFYPKIDVSIKKKQENPKNRFKGTYCPMKTNRGLEWYQLKAYDLPLFRWIFFF
jgi:hypothetical protein